VKKGPLRVLGRCSSELRSQPAALPGLAHCLGARPTVEVFEQASDVHFHRPRAKTQLRCSLLVSKSCSEKVEDFALAASRAGSSEDRCRIEPGQQRTRPEAPGDLCGIAVRLPDYRDITVTTRKTPLHPGCFQRQSGFSEQCDCFLKFMYCLAGIAFGAGGFGGHRSQRGTRFGVVVVLSDRIQNVDAVGDVTRTIVVRVKRRGEQEAESAR